MGRAAHHPPNVSTRQRQGGLGLVLTLVAGLVTGGAIGACANTDQNLEKQRLLDELGKAGSGKPAQCKPGAKEPCYTGAEGTAGRGLCKQGTHSCGDDASWGACEGEVIPHPELCNRADDDCDGVVDNDFERDGAICFIGTGSCKTQGVWHCSKDGAKAVCDAPPPPSTPEICDGLDNNCNGQIDEGDFPGEGAECSTGKPGVCEKGVKKCAGGRIQCVQNIQESPEVCNGLDDDCNNQVDDNCLSPEAAAKVKAGQPIDLNKR
ncbi:MAG: putative metal-binding motif-containing protein [Myxococcales bacterium]|nr:putative metal-binding motif-containing protein [Myxococcales bacterium]MCB9701694.1 putative metal-binding motif-containing protein [Myxococcales bacterium]